MQTKRFQLDLTEQEHSEMERLMAHAGLKTKREFVGNALTLFRWAAMELLQGRRIGSIDDRGNLKQLEMPALQRFSDLGLEGVLATIDELRKRSQESSRPLKDILDPATTGAPHEQLAGPGME